MRVTEPYTIYPRQLKSGIVYYYQIRNSDGTRSSAKSTGCKTLSQAKRFCQKLFNSGEFEKTSSTRFSIYTKDFFEKNNNYFKWKIVSKRHITDNTLLRYKQLLKYQLMPYFADFQLSAITRDMVKSWIIWASEKWSDKTVNNAQTVMNLILNQAVEQNIIKFNPANNLSFRKTDKKDRNLLTVEEVINVYNSSKWTTPTRKKAFLVAVITGMRIGEIVALQKKNIFENYLCVNQNYTKAFGLSDCKTHEKRFVPKPKELILESDTEWIFQQENGKPINISRIHDDLWKIFENLGINYRERNLNTHTLRNFFITYLQAENVSEAKIKAIVGHKDPTMTGLYTYWKPEMFQEVYDAQDKLYKLITGAN